MLKIGFCDDDLSVLKELQVLLDHYRVEKNRELVYTAYQSPLEQIWKRGCVLTPCFWMC